MIRVILILSLLFSFGCNKKYTNEDCVNYLKNDDKVHYDQLDKMDRDMFKFGASLICRKYDNKPLEVIKHIND